MPTTKILLNKSRLAAETDTEEGRQRRERGWKEHTSRDEFVTWQRNNKARKKELAKSKKKYTRGEREMKMANLHLFAFSSFCPQCAKVSSPSLPLPGICTFFLLAKHIPHFVWVRFGFVSFRFGQFLPSVLRALHTTHFPQEWVQRVGDIFAYEASVCLCVCLECVRELSTRHRTVNLMVILNKAMKTANWEWATVSSLRVSHFPLSAFPRLPSLTDSFKLNGLFCLFFGADDSSLKMHATWGIYESRGATSPARPNCKLQTISAMSQRHFRRILSATSAEWASK